MSVFQKLSTGIGRGTAVQGTDIASGSATSTQFLAANGSGSSAFRSLTSGDIPALNYVSSIAISVPSFLSVSGSPVTSSGTMP